MFSQWEQERQKLTKSIKVGDRVWIMESQYRQKIKTVTRITPTLIITGEGGEYDRYKIKDGYAYRRWGRDYIEKIAEPYEITDWETEQAEKQRKREEREAKEARREAKLKELNNECEGIRCYVNSRDWEEGRFTLTVFDINEAQVRQIVDYLQTCPNYPEFVAEKK